MHTEIKGTFKNGVAFDVIVSNDDVIVSDEWLNDCHEDIANAIKDCFDVLDVLPKKGMEIEEVQGSLLIIKAAFFKPSAKSIHYEITTI